MHGNKAWVLLCAAAVAVGSEGRAERANAHGEGDHWSHGLQRKHRQRGNA